MAQSPMTLEALPKATASRNASHIVLNSAKVSVTFDATTGIIKQVKQEKQRFRSRTVR